MQLSNKTLLLTGATGGIGEAIARQLTKKGARLLLTARCQAGLDQLRASLPKACVVGTLPADLTNSGQRQSLVDAALACSVDGLVNASGVNQLARFSEQDEASLESLMALNLLAPMQLTRSLLPRLRSSDGGLVVNLGSTFGALGHAGYVGYCASKFGLRGFSQALQRELAGSDVQVLYLAPRTTATKMNTPAAQWLNNTLGNKADSPDWVAQQLVKAIEQGKTSVHLGWPERFFVVLNQLMPGVVSRAMRRQVGVVDRCLNNENLMLRGDTR